MADSWDMSFLIDQATRIHEARGNFGKHLGKPMRGLVGDHLISFVAQEDRLLFLRFMARLLLGSGGTTATARIHTPIIGEKVFALDAQTSARPKTWWLMLSASNLRGYQPLSAQVSNDPLATGDEFGQLARSAARRGGGKLDVTLFHSNAVAERSFGKMTKERRAELDQKIGDALIHSSDTGIVTKPEEGQYAVVHGAGVSAEQMSERIIAAASEMNVSAEELGLSRTTQALEENIEAEEITRMIRGMRQKLAERTDDPVIGTVSFAANEDAEKKGLLKTLLSKIQK
ncbi:hypothetical protein [Dongia mobilis]|uniref:hypothetical protein n=1 Tax=Dongia sp. TaxID=1977262 RepID=UPI0026F0D231